MVPSSGGDVPGISNLGKDPGANPGYAGGIISIGCPENALGSPRMSIYAICETSLSTIDRIF